MWLKTNKLRLRWVMPWVCAVAVAVSGCSGEPDATAAGDVAADQAEVSSLAVSAAVQAMSVEQLRDAAVNALRENRIYAPRGDNAVEYYLALRDKAPNDPGVTSALTDLMPYTVIAAEQSVARGEMAEAQRLAAMLQKAEPTAAVLPRLRQAIATAQAAARQAREQAAKARASEPLPLPVARPEQPSRDVPTAVTGAAPSPAPDVEPAVPVRRQQEPGEVVAGADANANVDASASTVPVAGPVSAVPAVTNTVLRPILTPPPRYPADALRAGMAGEVVVEFTVGTDGTVTSARVVRASPARVFDREAVNAAKRWTFRPISEPVTTRRTINFSPGE